MGELQCPAVVAYDSATFREGDYEGLFAFGRGSKTFDPTKTGKVSDPCGTFVGVCMVYMMPVRLGASHLNIRIG